VHGRDTGGGVVRLGWWAASAALLTAAFGGGRMSAAQAERRWVAFDGREWTGFAPREKHAYVAGFLAGAALADGERAAPPDTAGLHRIVDSLYRIGGLRFPYGHVVYATQLDEFYWWDNHVPVRLYLALRGINDRMRAGQQGQQ
jgi:hypothetical protein